VNLILLFGVLVYFAREPISSFFRARHSQVKTDLDSAAGVLSDAEARLAEWQARADRLDAEIADIKRVAVERAGAESKRILADAEVAAERIRNDAGAAVNQEVARAREALRAEAATLATKLAAELLQSQVNEDDQRRLVDEFVARIEDDGNTGRTH
ncbi:MAG: ATP synthase F0 subunit B, partial [Myxococcales bacterium]|nr:ATP synthase F0 subunit B [Myxococcales bacterium]